MIARPRTLGSATPGATSRATQERVTPLVTTLVLRAVVNGAFAMWLATRAPGWLDIFSTGAAYALADGALGLLVGVWIIRRKSRPVGSLLIALVWTDALLRCGAGLAILVFPGIPQFPITLVLFYGALGSWAASAGVVAMVTWFVAFEHEHVHGPKRQPHSPSHALFDPLAVAGLLALMLAAYALVAGPPASADELRIAAGAASGALSLVFLVAAVGATRPQGRGSGSSPQ